MATITLMSGFSVIPEGTYVFQITNVEYKEAFGKMQVTMKTADGKTHVERFSFKKSDNTVNEAGLKVFSFFAKTAMNNFQLTEINETDLIGKYIRCEVQHDVQPNRNDPTKTVTFVRLGQKSPADGFDGEEEPAAEVKAEPGKLNLAALLGR